MKINKINKKIKIRQDRLERLTNISAPEELIKNESDMIDELNKEKKNGFETAERKDKLENIENKNKLN